MASAEQVAALRAFVRAGSDEYLADCWDTAEALVASFVGAADVPAGVLKQAQLKAGAELFHQRSAPQGIAQFADQQGSSPMRTARDPLAGAYPLLRPYVGMGIG